MICRSWGWVLRFEILHLKGPGKLRNIMMGGPGQMGGPSNIMGGPAPPNETMINNIIKMARVIKTIKLNRRMKLKPVDFVKY